MPATFPFFLSSPFTLTIALIATVVAALAILIRRPALPRGAIMLGGAGAVLLCLAAGSPVWQRPSPGAVAVMVDLSPSTRTADFRTRAQLETRIHSLLGKTPHRIYYFASDVPQGDPGGAVFPDIAAERTVFQPPAAAAAVVLFSDARFELPQAGPPTYVVIDPLLDAPADAAISSLEVRGGQAVVNVSNSGNPRRLTVAGMANTPPATAPSGSYVLTRKLDPRAATVSARLAPGDAWPENDQLVGRLPPAEHTERWWVGTSPPSGGWRVFVPANLPTDPAAYLAASSIVLQNIAATDLTTLQQQRLAQYVRDLGGGLIILGGDHAYAAGGYPGSSLEMLSPLASTPPRPTTHWILLADSSGSMAEVQGGFSLWHRAADAIVRLIPRLPQDDLLTVGDFAATLTWWSTGKTVRQTATLKLPPADVGPHGPTNLEQTLLDIAAGAEGDLPKHLLLLTDADAEIQSRENLEVALRSKKIHLHLLAIAEGSALPILRNIVHNTNGTLIRELDPQKWAEAIRKLMRESAPKLLGRTPLPVRFDGELSALPPREAMPWNRTWVKESATMLASGTDEDKTVAGAARWNVGEGRVLALAFDPGPAAAEALSRAAAGAPRDPRYRVSWETAARLRVTVDAAEGSHYLNEKKVTLELAEEAEVTSAAIKHEIQQIAPGRYEVDLPAPRFSTFAAVRVDGHLIDRIALAGRYAPEFDTIGNDHDAMEKLARRSGGQVVPPRQTWPIDFRWPSRAMPLGSVLAVIGASLVALGLGWWKLKG
jgi:hypothetical protein